jgi:Transcriptional Coactivator p15 (PC4)
MAEKRKGTMFAEWKGSRGGVTRLVAQEYKGQELLHLRDFYRDEKGEMKPTTRGVTIPIKHIGRLRKALRQAKVKLTPSTAF